MRSQLTVRKLADRSEGTRTVVYDRDTGARKLVNPATPGEDHEPWPLLGLEVVGDVPEETRVPTSWVSRGISEGWLEGINGRPVVRPAGPRQDTWNSTQTGTPHVFTHYDEIVLKTVTGDIRYRVTHQPDKYADYDQATHTDRLKAFTADDDTPVTPAAYEAGATRVDWFYDLELVS